MVQMVGFAGGLLFEPVAPEIRGSTGPETLPGLATLAGSEYDAVPWSSLQRISPGTGRGLAFYMDTLWRRGPGGCSTSFRWCTSCSLA